MFFVSPPFCGSMTGLSDAKAQVLAATDLVQLVSKTVALKKRGKEYVGLCPFHFLRQRKQ